MVETSVIVLTWNQKDLTIACIHSLLKQKYEDYEVILVDNGSEDGTPEAIKKEFGKKIKVVALKENRGFCGGNNAGVKECSKSSKYIMFLNNDTIVPDNLLSETVKSMKSKEDMGAVGVPIYNKGMEDYTKDYLAKNRSWTLNLFMEGVDINIDKKLKNNYFLFIPSGTCFLYKKELFKLPFDDDYFMYSEENYFAMRLWITGHECMLCRTTSVFHENSVIKKKNPKMRKFLTFTGRRNKLYNQLIFYNGITLLKLMPLMMIYNILETIADIKKIVPRIKAYFYILTHIRKVLDKRKSIRKIRKLSDKELISKMSSKFYSEERFKNPSLKVMIRIMNAFFYVYCIIFNIRTLERSSETRKKYGILLK